MIVSSGKRPEIYHDSDVNYTEKIGINDGGFIYQYMTTMTLNKTTSLNR